MKLQTCTNKFVYSSDFYCNVTFGFKFSLNYSKNKMKFNEMLFQIYKIILVLLVLVAHLHPEREEVEFGLFSYSFFKRGIFVRACCIHQLDPDMFYRLWIEC